MATERSESDQQKRRKRFWMIFYQVLALFWIGAGAFLLFGKSYFYNDLLHLDPHWEAAIFWSWEAFHLIMIASLFFLATFKDEFSSNGSLIIGFSIGLTLSCVFYYHEGLYHRNFQVLFPSPQFSVQLKIETLQETSETLALKLADIERSARSLQTQAEGLGSELKAIKEANRGRTLDEVDENSLVLKKLRLYQQQLAYFQKLQETAGKIQAAIQDLDLKTREAQVDKEMIATIERFGSESELKQMIDDLDEIIQRYDPDQYVVNREHLDLRSYEDLWQGL